MKTDHEGATLTPEGERIMTQFLASKKAASLVDKFKVSVGLFLLVGGKNPEDEDSYEREFRQECEELQTSAHQELIEYISELESLKSGS